MGMTTVGVREAKNRFSELTSQVNASGSSVMVLKNGKPWVTIVSADETARRRAERLARFRALTSRIDGSENEPVWDAGVSDRELLGEGRMRRFG